MKSQEATTATAKSTESLAPEVSSHASTSKAKSRYSMRVLFFASLSVLGCMLALANVAYAATPAGEDQYLEQAPDGGGNSGGSNSGGDDFAESVGGEDGTVTEADVKEAAQKNKKKAEKEASDDEGSTGSTGAAGSSGTTPPSSVSSVATAAKLGPFSRNTALALIALIVVLGGGALVLRGRGAPTPPAGGGDAGASSAS
jgi:hypothetical protein